MREQLDVTWTRRRFCEENPRHAQHRIGLRSSTVYAESRSQAPVNDGPKVDPVATGGFQGDGVSFSGVVDSASAPTIKVLDATERGSVNCPFGPATDSRMIHVEDCAKTIIALARR
jgi:hypothetical protein